MIGFNLDNMTYNKIMQSAKKCVNYERIAMSGVFVEVDERTVRMTALDGYKMLHHVIQREDTSEPISFIMPLISIPRRKSGTVKVECDGQRVYVTDLANMLTVSCDTIEGQFPDYRRVFPEYKDPAYIYVNARYLRQLLNSIDVHGEDQTIKIAFEGGEQGRIGAIRISKRGPQVNTTNLLIPVKSFGDDKADII